MKSVDDIVGPFGDVYPSGLVQRCKASWGTPIPQLSDLMLATYITQDIARSEMIVEAEKRIKVGSDDDSLFFEEQLIEAVIKAKSHNKGSHAD